MTKRIDQNRNTYDDPTTPLEIALNTSTYTKILDADPKRISYRVSNLSNNTILIREKAFGDDLERGDVLFGRSRVDSPPGNVAVGEIFAIALTGTPSVLPTSQ